MITFFKDSIRELQHVVWPTRKETTQFFIVVVIILILFGTYLALADTALREPLFYLREILK